jgi:hypothetical protein
MISTVSKPNATPISEWLEERFKVWGDEKPRQERTLKEFAAEIGIPYDTFFRYVNKGGKPEGENLKKIARKLGPEVYDILELERPDPDLDLIDEYWPSLPDSLKKSLAKQVHEHLRSRPR